MNRGELVEYINNSILIGDIVTENSEIYHRMIEEDLLYNTILGSVCVDGVYVKQDEHNMLHLVYYDRWDKDVLLGDCIDVIDSCAFAWNKAIRSISGDSVVKIASHAFFYSNIKKIDFPNLIVIEDNCFYHTNLDTVTLNKITLVPESAFQYSTIRSFIGKEVREVESAAFGDCGTLKHLILPKAIKIDKRYQWDVFDNLKTLQVPESCEFKE